MAAVAQLVERRFVTPVVAGSNPVGRPNADMAKWQTRRFQIPMVYTVEVQILLSAPSFSIYLQNSLCS